MDFEVRKVGANYQVTYKGVTEILDAATMKKTYPGLFNQLNLDETGKGITLQKSTVEELTDEEKAAKAKQHQAELDQVARMKEVAANGVTTEEGIITSHGNGSFTYDIKAPMRKKEKHTYEEEKDRMARYYDDETGETITGRDNLSAKRKEIKKAKKAAKKETKRYSKELKSAVKKGQIKDAVAIREKLAEAANKRAELTEKYAEIKQSHKASKDYGIAADKRAYNNNVKANNRLVEREVYFSEAEAKAVKKSPEAKGMKIKVASPQDRVALELLAATAQQHLDEASSPNEKALWRELANLFKDEKGNPVEPDTVKVQDALIDLTGGDMRLNYTEQKIISKELGLSMSDVRHLFKTYGFETPHPLGKRLANGAAVAAPVVATMGLSYLLTRSKSHAESHSDSHAHSEASKTVVVEAYDSQPGQVFNWVDPETGEEISKRIAGSEAYAKAIATATAEADAFASATAIAEATAALSPIGLAAAPVLAFLAGAVKAPVEANAARAGATTQKMATYVKMFKQDKNKNIGNQIIQMAGQITGDKAMDRAIIVAVLDHDIGSQNTVARTRELRNALAHLDAIKEAVHKFPKEPPKPPVEPPVEPPTPAPQPTACPVDSWFEPDYCQSIRIPRNSHGVSPIGRSVIRRGYLGPDDKPVTDSKILMKIQNALKGKIQMNPKRHSEIAAPLQLEIDGVIYRFDCDNALKLITDSREYKNTVGGGKDPRRKGIEQSGKYLKQDCHDNVPVEIDRATHEQIQADKKKKTE